MLKKRTSADQSGRNILLEENARNHFGSTRDIPDFSPSLPIDAVVNEHHRKSREIPLISVLRDKNLGNV